MRLIFQGLLILLIHTYCSGDLSTTYLATYSVILGSFEIEDYSKNKFTTFLFLVFTISTVLFFMYIYIAVLVQSYEKVQAAAKIRYGRWRIEFAAGQISLQNHFKNFGLIDSTKDSCRAKSITIFHWLTLISYSIVFSCIIYFDVLIIQYVVQNHKRFEEFSLHWLTILCGVESTALLCCYLFILFYIFRKQLRRHCCCPNIFHHALILFPKKYFYNKKDSEELELITNIIVKQAEERINRRISEMEERIAENNIELKTQFEILGNDIETAFANKDNQKSSSSSDDLYGEFSRSAIGLSNRRY